MVYCPSSGPLWNLQSQCALLHMEHARIKMSQFALLSNFCAPVKIPYLCLLISLSLPENTVAFSGHLLTVFVIIVDLSLLCFYFILLLLIMWFVAGNLQGTPGLRCVISCWDLLFLAHFPDIGLYNKAAAASLLHGPWSSSWLKVSPLLLPFPLASWSQPPKHQASILTVSPQTKSLPSWCLHIHSRIFFI